MSGLGLGMVVDQLADLKLGELLDTPPPGLDEAVAIAKAWPCHCPDDVLTFTVLSLCGSLAETFAVVTGVYQDLCSRMMVCCRLRTSTTGGQAVLTTWP